MAENVTKVTTKKTRDYTVSIVPNTRQPGKYLPVYSLQMLSFLSVSVNISITNNFGHIKAQIFRNSIFSSLLSFYSQF